MLTCPPTPSPLWRPGNLSNIQDLVVESRESLRHTGTAAPKLGTLRQIALRHARSGVE